MQEKLPLSLHPNGVLDGFAIFFCHPTFKIVVASGKASLSLGLSNTHTCHTLGSLEEF